MSNDVMLTTYDNPFNPFEQFSSWFLFDVEKGYNTCERLARVANIPEGLSEKETEVATNKAIDDMIKYDFLNIYKKVYSTSSSKEI